MSMLRAIWSSVVALLKAVGTIVVIATIPVAGFFLWENFDHRYLIMGAALAVVCTVAYVVTMIGIVGGIAD